MKAYVGADWSASDVAIAVATEAEQPMKMKGAKRSLNSVSELIERIRRRFEDLTQVHVFIESGASGWAELFHHAGAVVHVVDAKQAKRFGESWSSSGAKDDDRDASRLAWMGKLRCEHLPVWQPPTDFESEVEGLAKLHETLSKECTSRKQRVRARLRENFPELEAELSELRAWNLRLIRLVPTRFHAVHLTQAAFDEHMTGCGARRSTLDKIWRVIEAINQPLNSQARAEAVAFAMEILVDQVVSDMEALAKVEAQIETLTDASPRAELLQEFGGVAQIMSLRLLAGGLAGDLGHDRDRASILFGAAPVFQGSGKTKDGRPKGGTTMRRSANPQNRSTCYLLGRLASQNIGWARARYQHDRNRGKSAAHSYRNIARSLLRIMTAVLKTGERYDDARYVARLKAQGVPWATLL